MKITITTFLSAVKAYLVEKWMLQTFWDTLQMRLPTINAMKHVRYKMFIQVTLIPVRVLLRSLASVRRKRETR